MCPVGANGCRYADKYKRLEVLHRACGSSFVAPGSGGTAMPQQQARQAERQSLP